ncbi:MAG: SAM-dependent methyltransferase [Proteobacteria bacterium]|nr:SAM-dependent methyltransferase [Pseudomonadota bacterium]
MVVLDNYAPPAQHMVPGRYLIFGATPPLEGLNEFGRGKAQLILDLKEEHPLFRFVNLDQLFISRYNLLQPADDVEVLAEGSDGPVIVASARGPLLTRAVACGIPLRDVRGCILSNELVDAFPVHRFEMEEGKLREVYVAYR